MKRERNHNKIRGINKNSSKNFQCCLNLQLFHSETNNWFFEKKKQYWEIFTKIEQKKEEKRKKLIKLNDKENITRDIVEIQRIKMAYFKSKYSPNIDNLKEMDERNQDEIKNLNKSINRSSN